MLSVENKLYMLSVIMLNVAMLSIVMLNVDMLSIVMLNTVAPNRLEKLVNCKHSSLL